MTETKINHIVTNNAWSRFMFWFLLLDFYALFIIYRGAQCKVDDFAKLFTTIFTCNVEVYLSHLQKKGCSNGLPQFILPFVKFSKTNHTLFGIFS